MRRFAPAVILFIAFVLPGIAQAQTCPPPVIVQVGGTNPACAGQPVTLDAGAGWVTYQWSPGSATTRMISYSPNETMAYTVTTTDANGCSVTSQPLTVVVNATPAPPVIQLRESTICAGAQGEASITGTWSSYAWSVTNGTIGGGPGGANASGPTVDYTAGGTGTVTLSVTVTDSNGCAVTANADVPQRTIAKPVIQTFVSSLCPGSPGYASVNAPAEGGSWSSYHWTVLNGTITQWSSDSGSNISFYTSPGGQPVTVQVTATDGLGCSATSDPLTIPVRTIAKPVIQTFVDALCPGAPGYASVNAPAEGGSWSSYHWTVLNGTITQWSSDSGSNVSFYASPGGDPVTVQVTATDGLGCSATSDPVTIPVRTIAKPVIQTFVGALCPGSPGYASVNPPAEGGYWSSYHWTVTNGTITQWSSDSGSNISFYASPGADPVTVQVTATDALGCSATSDPVTIPVRTIAKPVIQTFVSAICPGSPGYASVNPPAEGGYWSSYHWTVVSGTITQWSGDSGPNVSFYTSPAGQPVTVQVTATDGLGCSATSDPVTIPVRVLDPPPITVASPSVCTGAYIDAHIDSPAYPNSPWQSVTWSATNAVTTGGGMFPNDTAFFATATGGPVTLTVTVSDMNGCTATSTREIPVAANPPTAVMTIPDNVCAGSVFTVTAHDPDNVVQWFAFNGTNATFRSNDGGGTATFTANGPGPVDIYATSGSPNAACAVYGHASTVAVNPPAATISASGPTAFCPGGSVTLTAPNGMLSYDWSNGATTQAITVTDPGSYTVTIANAPGCSTTSAPAVVTVNTPAIPTITPGGSTTICSGGSVTLTGSSGASYLWSTGATTRSINVTTAGTYTVSVTDANGCAATSSPAIVSVDTPAASIAAGGPTTFCPGGSVTLTANAGSAYAWSNGAVTRAISVASSGSYSVSVTDAAGCSATSQAVTVTVNAGPALPVITADGPTTFCDTTSVGLTAPLAGSYLWSNGATTRTTRIYASADVTVTVTDANGCSATSAPMTITALPRPVPTVTIPAQFCAGTTAHASVAETFASYSWSASNATIIGPTNGPAVDFTASTSGSCSLFLLVTNANGCQWGYNYYLNAQPGVAPSINTASQICTTDTGNANVSATAGSTWDWSATNATITGTFNSQSQPDPHGSQILYVPLGPGTVTLTVVEHASTGCSGTATRNVTIQAPAPTDFTVNATCPGGVGSASAVLNSYTFYTWSITNGSFIGNTANQRTVSFHMSADRANPSVITLTAGNGPGSCVTPATHTVPVATLAAPSIVLFPDSGICTGNGVTAYTASSGYDTYHWTISNGTIYSGASSYLINYSANAGGPTTLFLTVTKNGCSSSSSTVIPIADTTPPPITSPDSICDNSQFTASVPAGYINYSWSYAHASWVGYSSSGNAITLQPDGTGQTIQLSVTMQTTGWCNVAASSKTIPIVATPIPQITLDAPAGFCGGMTANASVANGPYTTYSWSITGGILNGLTNGPSVSFTPDSSGSTIVSVAVTDGRGTCSSTGSFVIPFVNPRPLIDGNNLICAGGNTTLSTRVPADSYLWSNGQTTPSITVTAAGDYTVTTTTGACSFTSLPLHISLATPSVTVSADRLSHCPGSYSTLTAISNGFSSYPLTYTWYATDQQSPVNSGYYQLFANSTITRTFYCIVGDNRGCSARSNDITITVFNPTAVITPSGPTTFCAGASVTLTANAGSSYSWSTGATTQSITVASSGSYNVYVVDTNGCGKTSASTNVTVNPLPATPTITAGGPTTFCAGGSVTLTGSSGASYLWSNGAVTQAITVNTSGNYSVTVRNGSGCSATSSATAVAVSALPAASITADGPVTFCAGGSVTLTASSGSSYLWSTGATTQSIAANTTGSYSVTVTGANGCTATSSPTVVSASNPAANVTAGGPTTFCGGGSVTLTASNGASYLWSTGATTRSITVSTAGSYSVTVADANGCNTTSAPTSVVVNANPLATITAGGPTTFCAGGSVTLTASSGSSYLWSNGATTSTITANTSGNYSVTITNASGCIAISSPTVVTANANPPATLTAGGPTTFCAGGSVTLTASSGASYLWSTGATTQAITASASGSYGVTVTNASGCGATSSPTAVTVNANPAATIAAGGPTTFCAGGSVTLTASSGASYLWSTGATTQSINVNTSGNYSATVTGTNGCSATSSPTTVTVNANPAAAITADGPTTFCTGGSVTLTASSGASYLWSTGATTQSISASTSGNYSVTVTNANGCNATSSPTAITVNTLPTATIAADGPTTFCIGGSVTLTASPAASYRWSDGETTSSIIVSNIAAYSGSYTVTVTNASGCSATSSPVTVTTTASPSAGLSTYGPTTFCAGGSVTFALTLPVGTSVVWSTGATTSSITVSSSGSYSAIITDANGCSATITTDPVTVKANPTPAITAGGPTTFCAGGSVTLTASSGTSYLWSTGATTPSIVAGAGGNYRVTVTNANGCSATSSPTAVTVNAPPTATITAGGPTTFCTGGSVTLTASSGSSYLWSTGATTQSISANTGGNYSVTVTNASGCSATSSPTTVTVNANPAASITAGGPTTFCIGGSVTLTASPAASYRWSTGATTSSIIISDNFVYSGSYTVTVTNASGCSATSSPMTVTTTAGPAASISSYGPTTFCAGGSVMLSASGGTSYLWSTGATTSSITVSTSGSYSATVTDANGCSATTATVPVTVEANPTATITAGGPTTFCAGGSVTLTASSGSSYLWSTGATTSSIAVSAGGSYSVTVTNASGCSATSAPTAVTVNANPAASITAGGPTTFCAGGSVTVTASSGSSYLWSNGATTSSITVSTGGSYSVTVTNASGCSATSAPTAVTVNANPAASITAGGPTTFCAGGSVTLTASSGSSYLWSTGATTSSITVNAGGSYTVRVTNAAGCNTTSAATAVTVNANPTATITAGGPTAICPGDSVTLTASSGTSYLWSNGATTPSISATAAGSYSVTVTNASGCSATSAPVAVTVKTLPTATVSGGGAICPGGSATITATLTGTAPWSVIWSDNVTQPVSSGTTATRSVSPSSTTSYTVTSISDAASCPRAGSGTATVTVNAPASITTQPVNKTTTRNTSVTLTVVAAGTSPISYQWFKGNGTSISGATSSSYTTSFTAKGTNTFYVEVWNACNTTHVKSTTVTVTVN